MRFALVAFLFATTVMPADDLPDWVIALSRIKHHTRDDLQRIPNYVCLETVDRYEAHPGKGFQKRDTLHLQVAEVDGKELTAPAEADRLDVGDLRSFAPTGTIGTGAFSSTAFNLFVSDNGRTTGWEREEAAGSSTWRFDFEISERESGFRVTSSNETAVVGERGSFRADAKTFDLLRLETEAVDIPLRLGLLEVSTRIEYHRVRIGKVDVLMPKSAEHVLISANGARNRNEITFSGCREYRTDSVIKFDSGK